MELEGQLTEPYLPRLQVYNHWANYYQDWFNRFEIDLFTIHNEGIVCGRRKISITLLNFEFILGI